MLRRAPTSISLSNRDVTEHLENIERKKRWDREDLPRGCGHKESLAPSAKVAYELIDSLAEQLKRNEKNRVTIYEYGKANYARSLGEGVSPLRFPPETGRKSPCLESGDDMNTARPDLGELPTVVASYDSEAEDDLESINRADTPAEHLVQHLESYQVHSSPKAPQKSCNAFDYGGFVDVNTSQLSSFTPQEASTPRNNEMPAGHRLRYKFPLPRSPLFLAQGANSPESRVTTSLTPRVASYGTPGLLLSQPARRPRSYRPRTISYSFEESERASTAYEQDQGSDDDSTGALLPPEPRRSLQEELEMGSSESASLKSNVPSSPPEFAEASVSKMFQATTSAEKNQRVGSSSPQLPLPPPFSAVLRNTSLTASLPSAHVDARESRNPSPIYDLHQLQASPVEESNVSPHKIEEEREEGDSDPGVRLVRDPDNKEEETDEGQSSSILRNFAALPLRLLAAYRSRSPFSTRYDGADSDRGSPLPERSQSQGLEETPLTNIRRPFQIYDDNMSPTSQPQTPQHLPEARHQSRFHPSYTAPASGGMQSPQGTRSERIRGRGTRSDSPTGMDTPGFQGLYGGRENVDDEVMFDRASQRLWALSSARRRGRSMSNTPDRETTLADGRGDIR